MSEIITQENYNASANSAIGEEDLRARDIDKENPTRFTDRDFQPSDEGDTKAITVVSRGSTPTEI